MSTSTTKPLVWEPPGPGQWASDPSHWPNAVTPIMQRAIAAMSEAMTDVFRDYGVPAQTMASRFVNGHLYTRLLPLIGAERPPRPAPPTPLLKVMTRLIPAFRARAKQATKVLAERPWNAQAQAWFDRDRATQLATNEALQSVELASLDDRELAGHVRRCVDHLIASYRKHFELHGPDLAPTGLLLVRAADWQLPAADVFAALAGTSPSTTEPQRDLVVLRQLCESAGVVPSSLDEVRAISDDARRRLDDYLRARGWSLVSRYDLDGRALCELPDVVLSSIRGATPAPETDTSALVDGLRAKVPAADRDEFDSLFHDAQLTTNLRDDNGPLTVEWPAGLVRRALLEAGRRLAARGALASADHAIECTLEEIVALLAPPSSAPAGTPSSGPPPSLAPSALAIAERAAERRRLSAEPAPILLGSDEPAPPLDALQPALAKLVRAVTTVLDHIGIAGSASAEARASGLLVGLGIGNDSYTGIARVAHSPEDALARLEPGDVLVVPFTTPAYNSVLAAVGAVVAEEGGLLSHCAVIARELGIPAVVGVAGAAGAIADGAKVTVDPVQGRVLVAG